MVFFGASIPDNQDPVARHKKYDWLTDLMGLLKSIEKRKI